MHLYKDWRFLIFGDFERLRKKGGGRALFCKIRIHSALMPRIGAMSLFASQLRDGVNLRCDAKSASIHALKYDRHDS